MDTTKEYIRHLSLCSGYEGIGLGLRRVFPNVREVAHVEIEAFAIANLVAKMEENKVSPAPIWTDLKTFPYEKFLGKVDCLSAGFPCPLFPKQENEKALKTQDTSTPTSAMESEDVDQDLFSWKTSKESSVPKQRQDKVVCSMSSKTWKAWVTSQRQEYSQRVKLAHHTRGKESLSWGTPRNCSAMSSTITPEIASNKKRFPSLETQVGQQHWATPQASDHIEGVRTGVKSPQKCLGRDLKMLEEKQKKWPTPSARDHKGTNSIEHIMGNTASKRGHMGQLPNAILKDGLADQENPNTSGKNQGQHLNPNWVEQLMGLPVGWTDLGSWETESYPKQ